METPNLYLAINFKAFLVNSNSFSSGLYGSDRVPNDTTPFNPLLFNSSSKISKAFSLILTSSKFSIW